MKSGKGKKLALLAAIMIIVTATSTLLTVFINKAEETAQEDTITIATSFYPVYIAALNVTEGMDHVKVVNLMQEQKGCLHDYQLTTDNMRTLEHADALIINGAGMESFIDDVKTNYKELDIIDSSKGISLLSATGEEHDHDHEEDHDHEDEDDHNHEEEADHEEEHAEEEHDHDHDHGTDNAHIWVDPARYEQQITNIAEGLSQLDKENSETYQKNAEAYLEKVKEVETELAELKDLDYKKVILFHNSMQYLCETLGIEVPYSLNIDEDTSLSAGDVAKVIEEVKEHDIKVLFSEKQYESSIAERISKETGANVYVFDSLVTGDDEKDAYLEGMRKNIEVFKKALYK